MRNLLHPGYDDACQRPVLRGPIPVIRTCRKVRDFTPFRFGRRHAAAIVLLLLSSVGAAASEPIRADPWQIIHIAREFGPAEVHRDGMNDPQIRGELDGQSYRIDFYGCRLGRDCESVLLSARLSFKGAADASAREFPQEWNRRKLVGRAWFDPGGRDEAQMVLDHPILLGEGVAEPVFRASMEQWRAALGEFIREFTRWRASS
ncbi:MAG TPA: YbjN domain-containing protein [Paracoccaceae bacterium]|nr:YbjN domain-containing protein [Paracoccaceae bacterium]